MINSCYQCYFPTAESHVLVVKMSNITTEVVDASDAKAANAFDRDTVKAAHTSSAIESVDGCEYQF